MIGLLAGLVIVLFVLTGIFFTLKMVDNIKNNGMTWFFIIFIIAIWLILGLSSCVIISVAI